MSNDRKWLIAGIAGFLLLCLCVILACLLAGGLAIFSWTTTSQGPVFEEQNGGENPPSVITVEVLPAPATPVPGKPAEPAQPGDATVTPSSESAVPGEPMVEAGAAETLNLLESETIPINDPRALALRLEGKSGIPETLEGQPSLQEVGAGKSFWVTNSDSNQTFEVDATLRYVGENLYFWIEDGVSYRNSDLERLARTFDEEIVPLNREFFGSEWNPGVDNDPRMYVLYARNIGQSIAGYFSSSDSFHPEASQYSNAHEMFLLSADNVDLGEDYIYGTMAHEYQHMIHWYRDRNEESWLNEGFSELAQFLNGYDTGGMDFLYVMDPDIQLTYWPGDDSRRAHYGASFLFVSYFLDRLGEEATKAVVAHPDNGMDSIDRVLEMLYVTDPVTGQPVRADDIFADWVVTSLLNDENVSDGRFAYRSYAEAPQADITEEIRDCDEAWEERDVRQYGVDYIRMNCSGSVTLQFTGEPETGVLSTDPYSGAYAFWSNRGDESNMTLTREFDFTSANGPLTLTYQTWYDLEDDYDYVHLVISRDGENWEVLRAPSTTDEDPSGNSYGWGYNGESGGWIEESVDLSEYAGEKVWLRFEYITDAAVNEEGFLVDDIRIPEVDYIEDFEAGEGGWTGDGFVRLMNRLPQTFQISVIRNGRSTAVETVALQPGQTASIPLNFEDDLRNAVLVVSGTTRFTTQPAVYRYRFIP